MAARTLSLYEIVRQIAAGDMSVLNGLGYTPTVEI